jgi:hypothetical protein
MGVIIPDWVTERVDTQQERYWNPILQELDPNLWLIKPMTDPPYGMTANRWHIARFSDHADRMAFFPIETPDGGFREMDQAMFEALKRMDSHSTRSNREQRRREERERAKMESRKRAAREDRATEFAERLEQKLNTSVRVPKEI